MLCTVFICLIAASASGGAFAYFSHGSDGLLPSIVVPDATALPTETERGPLFAPFNPAPDPVVPDPPDVVNDPAWLIATSGFCSNLNVVMKERDVEASETDGDMAGHFVADISFNYYPQSAVKFTDFPHHIANTIEGDAAEADALVSAVWDHKNIALLEPTSTCGVDEQGRSNQAWGVSVFKVEDHRPCTADETSWEGHACVHYSGYVSAETSNFVNVNEGRFVCQLFVDSVSLNPGTFDPGTCCGGAGHYDIDGIEVAGPCRAAGDGCTPCHDAWGIFGTDTYCQNGQYCRESGTFGTNDCVNYNPAWDLGELVCNPDKGTCECPPGKTATKNEEYPPSSNGCAGPSAPSVPITLPNAVPNRW